MPADETGDQPGMALSSYRMIRLGLEAMWNAVDGLPDGADVDPGGRPALVTITNWLDKAEQGELRDTLMTRNTPSSAP